MRVDKNKIIDVTFINNKINQTKKPCKPNAEVNKKTKTIVQIFND